MLKRSAIALVLGAPLFAALHTRATVLPPEEFFQRWTSGEAHLLRFEAQHELANTLYSLQLGDADPSYAPILPTLRTTETRHLCDLVLETNSDRPLRVRRKVVRAELEAKLDFQSKEVDPLEVSLRSSLVLPDTTVAFEYVPEEGIYGKLYDANAAAEETLRGLRLDAEAGDWLPSNTQEASWSVPVAALRQLLSPGGDPAYVPTAVGGAVLVRSLFLGFGGSLDELVDPAVLQGTVTARLEEVSSSRELGQVHVVFDFDVTSTIDQAAAAQAYQLRNEALLGIKIQRAQLVYKLKGQGRVVWDAKAGRIQAYNLDGVELLDLDLQTQLADEPVRSERTQFQGRLGVQALVAPFPIAEVPKPWTEMPVRESEPAEPR